MTINRRQQLGSQCTPLARLALLAAVAALAFLVQAQHGTRAADTWIAASVASYHFDRAPNYNERNWGIGLEHGVMPDVRLVAGSYENSFYRSSAYAGATWTPLRVGPARLGFVGGVIDGYSWNHGRFFPMAAPWLVLEREGFGVNMLYVPRFADNPGVLGFQIKFRLPI